MVVTSRQTTSKGNRNEQEMDLARRGLPQFPLLPAGGDSHPGGEDEGKREDQVSGTKTMTDELKPTRWVETVLGEITVRCSECGAKLWNDYGATDKAIPCPPIYQSDCGKIRGQRQ